MTNAKEGRRHSRTAVRPSCKALELRINAIVLGRSAVSWDTFGVHIASRVHELFPNAALAGLVRDGKLSPAPSHALLREVLP